METAREELEELDIRNYEQKSFVPHHELRCLLDERKVTELIQAVSEQGKIQVYQQHEVVSVILDSGLRLFATLLSLSRPEMMLKFVKTDHFTHPHLDSRLPMSKHDLNIILGDEKIGARFYRNQWRFLAPFFCADQSHRELEDETILPFIECHPVGEGGFGEISKLSLIGSHQGLVPESKSKVLLPWYLTSSYLLV